MEVRRRGEASRQAARGGACPAGTAALRGATTALRKLCALQTLLPTNKPNRPLTCVGSHVALRHGRPLLVAAGRGGRSRRAGEEMEGVAGLPMARPRFSKRRREERQHLAVSASNKQLAQPQPTSALPCTARGAPCAPQTGAGRGTGGARRTWQATHTPGRQAGGRQPRACRRVHACLPAGGAAPAAAARALGRRPRHRDPPWARL